VLNDEILEVLRNDLAHLKNQSVVLRVPKLPMNSLIEVELMCEVANDNQRVYCTQQVHSEMPTSML
jgi:hypothetical protein